MDAHAANPGNSGRLAKRAKFGHSVAQELVRRIAHDKVTPGQALGSEAALVESLGVARSTLREGLRILELLGFVRTKSGPGGGPIVNDPASYNFDGVASLFYEMTGTTYRELLQARLALEPLSVRLVAERRDPADLAAIRRHLDMSADLELNDEARSRRLAGDFHQLLVSMSGNTVIGMLVRSCLDVRAALPWTLHQQHSREWVVAAHVEIGEAIIAGDVDGAEALMRQHMLDVTASTARRYSEIMDEPVTWS